jgi:pimeloyl-ACP methyl ester carboxylesterase
MRSDFIYWAMITYLKPYSLIGVPKGFVLTPELKAEVEGMLASTLPLSARIDGFLFDTYDPQLQNEFYQETSDASPYPLGKIETPTLVINALDDPYAAPENVRGLVEKFPNARLLVVPDGGHLLLGHTTEVFAEIVKFLRSNMAEVNNAN